MNVVLDNFGLFWLGFVSTLHLLTVSGVGALVLGTVMASLRVSPFGSFRALSAIYTEILRNTPLTLVFFFCVFVLPKLGVILDFQFSAIIALTAVHGSVRCRSPALGNQWRARRSGRGRSQYRPEI